MIVSVVRMVTPLPGTYADRDGAVPGSILGVEAAGPGRLSSTANATAEQTAQNNRSRWRMGMTHLRFHFIAGEGGGRVTRWLQGGGKERWRERAWRENDVADVLTR